MRKIIVDNVEWTYKIGKQFVVVHQYDQKKKHLIAQWKLLGYDRPSDWEMDVYKRTINVNIIPSMIVDFIRHADWYKATTTTSTDINELGTGKFKQELIEE